MAEGYGASAAPARKPQAGSAGQVQRAHRVVQVMLGGASEHHHAEEGAAGGEHRDLGRRGDGVRQARGAVAQAVHRVGRVGCGDGWGEGVARRRGGQDAGGTVPSPEEAAVHDGGCARAGPHRAHLDPIDIIVRHPTRRSRHFSPARALFSNDFWIEPIDNPHHIALTRL